MQEVRAGALRRGLSAFLQKGLAKNRKSAAAENLPGAQDLRHTGCVRVKMRHPTPERAGRRMPQDHAGSEGRSAAARAVGLFAKRPGEKPQKRCGGKSARRAAGSHDSENPTQTTAKKAGRPCHMARPACFFCGGLCRVFAVMTSCGAPGRFPAAALLRFFARPFCKKADSPRRSAPALTSCMILRHPPPRPFRRRMPHFHSYTARVAQILRTGQIFRRSAFAVFRQAFLQKGRQPAPQRSCPHFLHDPAAPSAPPVPASDAACSLLHSPCGANPARRADSPPQRFCSFSPGLFAKRPTARAAVSVPQPLFQRRATFATPVSAVCSAPAARPVVAADALCCRPRAPVLASCTIPRPPPLSPAFRFFDNTRAA